MVAANVDTVGRNANWSEKVSNSGEVRKVRYKYSRWTTTPSVILVSIGVTDIGRKSE